MQETDLEVEETILAEEQACGLHPFNRQDLLAELEVIRARVDGSASGWERETGRLP
jgi:hypothetical protein